MNELKEEYTKTSLHNHFGGDNADYTLNKTRDSTFNIDSAKCLLDSANNQGYQMLGFTNSNVFWYDEFKELNQYISEKKYKITLIPGVELNIISTLSAFC